jgi:hypothetical protein
MGWGRMRQGEVKERTIKKRKREEEVGFREIGWGRMRQGEVRERMRVKSEENG